MRIDVWSDVVCPWCYLGKRRLDVALEGLDFADEVEVRWRAFQLDPTATAEPKDLSAAIERKYGPGAFRGMTGRLVPLRSEEHTSELPSLMRISYAVFCLKQKQQCKRHKT